MSSDLVDILTPEDAAEDINPLHYAAAIGDTKAVAKVLAGKQRSAVRMFRSPKKGRKVESLYYNTAMMA